MNETFEKAAEDLAAFQKIWGESLGKMMQAAFSAQGNSPPPEVLKQIRSGMFQALAQSWEEFMRSPQFLDGMKQWMDNAIQFRKMTNDFATKVRNDIQAPSREDLDSIILAVRHMESNLRERVDALAEQVSDIQARLEGGPTGKSRRRPGAAADRAKRKESSGSAARKKGR
jgi:hypothetical protein